MKIKSLVMTAVVAVGVGWAAQSARAALTYTAGDLFLGFRQDSSKSYLVNIGSVSNYSFRNGASFTVGNFGLDLSSTSSAGFGTNWFSDDSVSWSVTGTTYVNLDTPPVLFVTAPRSSPGIQSTPWVGRSSRAQTSTVSKFQELQIKYTVEGKATANNPKGTYQEGQNNTYSSYTSEPTDFGTFGGIEGNFGELSGGAAASVLDLYQIDPVIGQAGTYLGRFTINNSGVVTFTAVPEPGTLALLGLGAVFTLYRLRRSRRALRD